MAQNVRTMTIVVNAEDDKDITILADNMEGAYGFYEEQIRFLKNVLENLEEKSQMTKRKFEESFNEYDAAMWG